MDEETKPLSQFYELFGFKKSAHKATIYLRFLWEQPEGYPNVKGSVAIIMMALNAVVDAVGPTLPECDRGISSTIFHTGGEICIPLIPLSWLEGTMLQWHIERSGDTLDIDDTVKFEFCF